MITENLSTLKIHKLTQEQYDRELAAGRVDANALYLTPEEEIDLSPYATIEQLNGKADAEHEHSIEDINNLQSSLDSKQNTITGAATTITGSNLTESRALVSDSSGKVAVSDITSTELGYLDGVTTYIQAQLDVKSELGHGHSASDITYGILPVARGGTGNSDGYVRAGQKSGTTVNQYATAEGWDTTASGLYSHAEGADTTASGGASHAEGYQSTASGKYSHAEGYKSTASGEDSHAEGRNTIASGIDQHVQGRFNISDESSVYAHIVGNGAYANALSNAHTLDWDGNAWFAGDVYVGSTSGTNKDDGSKRLVTKDQVLDYRNLVVKMPSNQSWYSVTYGNGKFVAIAANSTAAAYSIDGINWVETTRPYGFSGRYLTYGNGKFVNIASNSTAAAYSIDGINWEISTMPPNQSWCSVTYGNGKFVAIAINSTAAAYSIDGINWETSTMPSTERWYSVTYGNGKFVAIANNSTAVAYSTDGINWETSTMPSTEEWTFVTYGNGKFVAVTGLNNYCDAAAYSTDGINWVETVMPRSSKWASVAYGNGKFVAVSSEYYRVAAYSTDGINWEASTMPFDRSWYSVTYGNGKFVAIAANSTAAAYSIDGINWKDGELGLFQNNADVTAEVADVISKNLTDVVYAGEADTEATSVPLNADTLGGKLPSEFAPAGYGLGEARGKIISTPDEAVLQGFYNVANDNYVGDGTFHEWRLGWCSLLVERRGDVICQTAKYYTEAMWFRASSDGGATWNPWEWVNPPMALGVEYRTTERWNGKPVYAKAVNFGTLAPANASVAHGIANIKNVVSKSLTGQYGSELSTSERVTHFSISASTIEIDVDADLNQTATVIMKYTKTTD